jgi:hypothetical protein
MIKASRMSESDFRTLPQSAITSNQSPMAMETRLFFNRAEMPTVACYIGICRIQYDNDRMSISPTTVIVRVLLHGLFTLRISSYVCLASL